MNSKLVAGVAVVAAAVAGGVICAVTSGDDSGRKDAIGSISVALSVLTPAPRGADYFAV